MRPRDLDWNTLIGIVFSSDYHELNRAQRSAYLALWYHSEVCNGGHLQYFENQGVSSGEACVKALISLGARHQCRLLEQAIQRWTSTERTTISSVEEYCEEALKEEFGDLDRAYHDCAPTINEILERCLEDNPEELLEPLS